MYLLTCEQLEYALSLTRLVLCSGFQTVPASCIIVGFLQGYPGVYARISELAAFIDSIVADYTNPTQTCPAPAPTPVPVPPTPYPPIPGCVNYQIKLKDSWGDGWNWAVLTLPWVPAGASSPAADYTFTMHSGSSATQSACLPPGSYTPYCCGGEWESEVSWEVGGLTGGADENCAAKYGTFVVVDEPGYCQDGNAKVVVEGASAAEKDHKSIKNLRVGEKVLIRDSRSGDAPYFAPITGIAKSKSVEPFVEVKTEGGHMVKVTKMHTFPRCDGKGEILATELDPRGDQEHSCVQTVDGLRKITGIHWAQYAGDETFTLEVASKGPHPAVAAGGIFNHVKQFQAAAHGAEAVSHDHDHASKKSTHNEKQHAALASKKSTHNEKQHAALASKKSTHNEKLKAPKQVAADAKKSKSTLRGAN